MTKFSVELPNIAKIVDAEIKRGERIVAGAVKSATHAIKSDWRNQITSAGLGRKLSNTIRAEVFPRGRSSFNAAGNIWSKAPHIIAAHDGGKHIKSKDGFWLAIPLPAAGKGRGGRRITPLEFERTRGTPLRFVYRRGRTALLVADNSRVNARGHARIKRGRRRKDGILSGAQTVPIFVLVPRVKLQNRTDLISAAERISNSVLGQIVSELGR